MPKASRAFARLSCSSRAAPMMCRGTRKEPERCSSWSSTRSATCSRSSTPHNAAAPYPAPVEVMRAQAGSAYAHYADRVWDTTRMNNILQHFATALRPISKGRCGESVLFRRGAARPGRCLRGRSRWQCATDPHLLERVQAGNGRGVGLGEEEFGSGTLNRKPTGHSQAAWPAGRPTPAGSCGGPTPPTRRRCGR
jgi:hypothetical protein